MPLRYTPIVRMYFLCLGMLVTIVSWPLGVHAGTEPPFRDVPAEHPAREAIVALRNDGIIKGYPDGTFRPGTSVTRAEFLKMLIEAEGSYHAPETVNEEYEIRLLSYSDIEDNAWYVPYIRRATLIAWISGYPDGTVRPGAEVSFTEAAKLAAAAFGIPVAPSQPWYRLAVEGLAEVHAIPPSVGYLEESLTRAEVAEMLWRLSAKVQDRPSRGAEELLAAHCTPMPEARIDGVDAAKVRAAWLGWVNEERATRGLDAYAADADLDRTATIWSFEAAKTGTLTHKRPGQTAYYDYNRMIEWFNELGITFGKGGRTRFTENIAWGPLRCSGDDCTDEAIAAAKMSFDSYMREEASGGPHFNSIVQPAFRRAGVGIAANASRTTLYFTFHYAVAANTDALPLCL